LARWRFVPGQAPMLARFPHREPSLAGRIVVQTMALEAPLRADIETEVLDMLGWVVTFLIIALIAGILGFGGIAGASIEIAKIIFFIAVVLFLVSAVIGVSRGRSRV